MISRRKRPSGITRPPGPGHSTKINKKLDHAAHVPHEAPQGMDAPHATRRHQHLLLREAFRHSRDYALEYQGNSPRAHFFNTRIRRVSELCRGFDRGRVLDIGCGPAIVGSLFRGRKVEYHGADISEHMIGICRESYGRDPQFLFSVQSVEELGFWDASFDMVLCLGVLEYVLDQKAAIREMTRVLRPGGILIATMLNRMSPCALWERWVHLKLSLALGKAVRIIKTPRLESAAPGVNRGMRPRTLLLGEGAFRNLMTSGGLRIEDALAYSFCLIPSPLEALVPRLSVFVSRNLECLCRSPLRFLGRGIMVKCRKGLEEDRP